MSKQVDLLTSVSGYISNISLTHKYIKENLRIIKASTEDISSVKKLSGLDDKIGDLLLLDSIVLKELRDGYDEYEQNFSLKYDIALEEVDNGIVVLSKKRRGYYVSITLKTGERVFHKFYDTQLSAMKSFLTECEKRE